MSNAFGTHRCTFIIPIRRVKFDKLETRQFVSYFRTLELAGCEVIVVDGSRSAVFEQHRELWNKGCLHVAPDPKYTYLNGKVNGVHTAVDLATCEKIILADDDIRYKRTDIDRMCDLLDEFEMVRPQNFISPLPWWARIESARILINRGLLRAGDYPGTCGFRRSTMLSVGPYDGDVLFDNEELVRHFALSGATIQYALDFFILKRPPSFPKWCEQRPRQAYEDFVMRIKTAAFLLLLPLAVTFVVLQSLVGLGLLLLGVLLISILSSTRGLLRNSAYRVFPLTTPLYSPIWVLERSISVYWALFWWMKYGGYPFGSSLLSKGTGTAWIAGGRIQSRDLAARERVQ